MPVIFVHDVTIAALCLSLAFLFAELIVGPIWAVPMDIAPRYAGTASGMMNFGFGMSSILMPWFFGRMIDLTATAPNGASAHMGGTLHMPAGQTGALTITTEGFSGLKLQLVTGTGAPALAPAPEIRSNSDVARVSLPGARALYWVRVNVRDPNGKLVLLSNPVWVAP